MYLTDCGLPREEGFVDGRGKGDLEIRLSGARWWFDDGSE